MSLGFLVILVCHAEYEAKHIVACDFTNEIVFPALKSAKSCQTVNIVHLSEQKVMFYRASFTSPCNSSVSYQIIYQITDSFKPRKRRQKAKNTL